MPSESISKTVTTQLQERNGTKDYRFYGFCVPKNVAERVGLSIMSADKFKFEQVQNAKAKTINRLILSFAGGARKASAVFAEQ